MEFRDLSHSDINNFYDLFRQIMITDFPEYDKKTIDYFLNSLYTKNHFFSFINSPYKKNIVLADNDEIHGFLVADQGFGGVGFVSWFGIREEYRKKGYGKALIDRYEEFCKSKGAHLIEVYTFPKTVDFYNRIGFIEIGRREKGYFGVINIIMDKKIS